MAFIQWIVRSKGRQVRLATLSFGLLLVLAPAGLLNGAAENGGATGISIAALVTLLGVLVVTAMVRRQISIWEGPATAVLAVLAGIGLDNPLAVTTICMGVVIAQSMYGGLWAELIRVVALLPVVPLTVVLSVTPTDQGMTWNSPASLAFIPAVPLFAGLVRLLKGTLETQAQAQARARFMAELTGNLLAADSMDRPGDVLAASVTDLVRITPGLTMVGVRSTHTDGTANFAVRGVFGHHGEDLPRALPPNLIGDLPQNPRDLHELKGISRRMEQLGLPANLRWYVHADVNQPATVPVNTMLFGLPLCLSDRLFGIPGSRTLELLAMLRALIEQRQLAYDYLQVRQEMLMFVNRDDATGLAKRSGFLPLLDNLLDHGADSVALILIGLDELDIPAVDSSSGSASLTVSELAQRLLEEVGDRGASGRFCDNRFIVAVPMEGPRTEVTVLVESIRRRLTQPVQLSTGSVLVPISIGVACSQAGTTGWELIERATRALRSEQESKSGVGRRSVSTA